MRKGEIENTYDNSEIRVVVLLIILLRIDIDTREPTTITRMTVIISHEFTLERDGLTNDTILAASLPFLPPDSPSGKSPCTPSPSFHQQSIDDTYAIRE